MSLNMSKPRLLSGEEVVARGATKITVSLPEIGLKDVIPNGSWLEQKQIQSAIDARKILIEVERIEKSGNVSHAQWREDLMLAEVTKQNGGYWHYMGHHSGKVLYLRPEEALYLMEVNCLHLKYNDVTVSLQQGYTLLLRDQVSIMQYKVYASLSRLGYRIFRFSESKENKTQSETSIPDKTNEIVDTKSKDEESEQNVCSDDVNQSDFESKMDTSDVVTVDGISQSVVNNPDSKQTGVNEHEIEGYENKNVVVDESMESDSSERLNCGHEAGSSNTIPLNYPNTETNKVQELTNNENDSVPSSSKPTHKYKTQTMMYRLLQKRHRSCSSKNINNSFENIPDTLQKETVTVIVPTQHLPHLVTPRYASYDIDLKKVRTKTVNTSEQETNLCENYRIANLRLENSNQRRDDHAFFYSKMRFQQPSFNQFHFFRQRQNTNAFTFNYNMFFQRPFMRNSFFAPRFQFFSSRPPPLYRTFNFHSRPVNSFTRTVYEPTAESCTNRRPSSTNSRKRPRDSEQEMRLGTIKHLASNLKTKRSILDNNLGLVNFLKNLISIYNIRYNARIRLSADFSLEDEDENIIETITLEDDEVPDKRPKNDDSSNFNETFNKIRQLAAKLKELESQEMATPRHRRALSSVVRTFNDSFNADIYINGSYDVVDRRHITLDSSSESDCVIKEEEVKKSKKKVVGKKVRNPFNLLKTLSEKNKQIACCSKDNKDFDVNLEEIEDRQDKEYSEEMKRSFKSWLPPSHDFGRAEIASKNLMLPRIIEANRQTILYDFMKNHTCKFVNWLDVKISFLETMESAASMFHNDHVMENGVEWDSIIKPEDCKDMASVLNKLSIIPNNSEINKQTSLKIDFDVYNRDVPNFRKSNLPKPHFRILCVNQSSGLPQGACVAALHAQYGDVPLVLAVVGASVSYLQVKPINLPVYIPEGEAV